MKTKIHPNVIFRTPKFSYLDDLTGVWEELKEAISISSFAFFEVIKDVEKDDLENLPQKVRFTIWKYFNRAKFRSTPYGTFASVGLLTNCFSAEDSKIVISHQQTVDSFIDWPYKSTIERDIKAELLKDCELFSNSTFYKTKDGLRYVSYENEAFEISEIGENESVENILLACLKPIKVSKLISYLGVSAEEVETVQNLLVQMYSLQLIFTEKDPNSIGIDFFERTGVAVSPETPKYLLANRIAEQANFDQKLFQHLPSLVSALNLILPLEERPPLSKFIERFKKKFDQREVPLVIALDPEMGIGYEDLEQSGGKEDFITQFVGRTADKQEPFGKLKQEIEVKLTEKSFKRGEPIFLDKIQLDENKDKPKIPNTFSILLTVADDLVFADTIGGATANALAGRFTLGSKEIESHCRQIANIEQEANPDVLFFDVSYLAESNVDNINRRKLIYDYQLSILNFDTSEDPLNLNDLMISVIGSEIVLRSKKHNKRVAPLMASAYNYSRSDLSAFRLLCDLQHHKIQTTLSFSLSSILPDLSYYPRLQFRNIVLSAAKWKVEKKSYEELLDGITAIKNCREYLEDIGVPAFFKAGLSDQTLCFNLQSDDDIDAFIQFMQKKESVYVEEVIIPNNNIVVDERGKPYLAQFNLSMYHKERVFGNFAFAEENKYPEVKQFFPLGEEWLYFEIHCHQQRSDEILLDVIANFVDAHQAEIKVWFFIRYNENGDHLRFRMLLADPAASQILTAAFTKALTPYLKLGLVSDVQSKMYRRELERYQAENIEDVEVHFCADSNFVLSFLATHPSDFEKYKSCIKVIEIIGESKIFDPKFFVKLIRQISDSFNVEHILEAVDFKKLNEQYQNYRVQPNVVFDEEQQLKFNQFCDSNLSVLRATENIKKPSLFSSLLHMHINRLFVKNQRVQEMVVYYFSLKDAQRKQALNKN